MNLRLPTRLGPNGLRRSRQRCRAFCSGYPSATAPCVTLGSGPCFALPRLSDRQGWRKCGRIAGAIPALDPYLLHLTARDGGNAKGLQAQSLPCSRRQPLPALLSALAPASLYLVYLTARDGGNAEGLKAQSLPCSRRQPLPALLSALAPASLYLVYLIARDGGNAEGLQEQSLPCSRRQPLPALLYLLHLTARDGGNAKGLQEQSLPCSRARFCARPPCLFRHLPALACRIHM
jgi:hypothetical protein